MAASLHTASYRVEIADACLRAGADCADVQATLDNRLTGDTRVMRGRAIHAACAGARCPVIGFQFRDGLLTYTVMASGELLIVENRQVLVLERGGWR